MYYLKICECQSLNVNIKPNDTINISLHTQLFTPPDLVVGIILTKICFDY